MNVNPDQTAAIDNDWRLSITSELREYLAKKIMELFSDGPTAYILPVVRNIENEMYSKANSRSEYYHLIAEKIYQIVNIPAEERRSYAQSEELSAQLREHLNLNLEEEN